MSARTIPLKQWFYEEAQRHGVSKSAIVMRYYRGKYGKVCTHRIGTRTIFVLPQTPLDDFRNDLL